MGKEAGQEGNGAGEGQNAPEPIKIGDKEYKPQDLEAIIAQNAKGTQALQTMSQVEQLAARYNMPVEEFIKQTEGSFAVVSNLMDQGVIDATGQLVQKKGAEGSSGDGEEDFLKQLLGEQGGGDGGEEGRQRSGQQGGAQAALVQALKEIGGQVGNLQKKVEVLQRDNTALLRNNLKSQIKSEFPDLSSDADINLVIGRAQADQSKSLRAHAKALVEEKTAFKQQAQKELAEQLGIKDLDAHLNALKQQDPSGGPGVMFKNKKFSLRPKGENEVHPRDAAREYLDKALGR